MKQFELNLAYHFSEYLNYPLIEPHWVYISLLHECNNNCKMCGVKSILQKDRLSLENIKKVLQQIKNWKSNPAVVFTGGEPFLREDILEVINSAVSLGIDTELVSNGSLLDKEKAEKIIQSGLKNIAVSLDGATEKTHDYIRGKEGSFKEVLEAIEHLVFFKRKYSKGPQISVWTTIMESNIAELYDVFDLAKKLKIDCLVYHPVIVKPDDMQHTTKESELWVKPENLDFLKKQVEKIVFAQEREGLVAFLHDPYLWVRYFTGDLKRNDWKCNPFEFLSIGPDGDISICGKAFGNINDSTVRECLLSLQAGKAREKMKKCDIPCLQTCWARPEADDLKRIVEVFLKNNGADSGVLKAGGSLLDKYRIKLTIPDPDIV